MATKSEEMNLADSCLNKAENNEPIFVLRAQDRFAPILVRMWADMYAAFSAEYNEDKFYVAVELAEQMEEWPNRRFPT